MQGKSCFVCSLYSQSNQMGDDTARIFSYINGAHRWPHLGGFWLSLNAVRGFDFLQQNVFQIHVLNAVANKDLWKIIFLLARNRGAPVEVFQVKAHVSCRDLQAHNLTAGNSEVDSMAKNYAKRIFNEQIQDPSATINGRWRCKFIWFPHCTSGQAFWNTFKVLTKFLILISRLMWNNSWVAPTCAVANVFLQKIPN